MVEPSTLELRPPPVRSLAHHDADADADADGISTSSLSGRLYFVPKKSVLCTRVARARAGVVDGHLLLLWGSTLLLWVRPVQVPNLILKCFTIRSAVSSL